VGSGTVVVIVVVAVIVILAVVLLLSMRARRRRASASHHIGLPKLGSLSSAADQTTGGVDHVKDEGASPRLRSMHPTTERPRRSGRDRLVSVGGRHSATRADNSA
jgi:hypothetical protein